ncbi:MAG TPA: hypothetical protein VF646_12170 [Cytophagales bacterium]
MKSAQPPVLFHPLKHHLGWIRAFLQESALGEAAGLPRVAAQLITVGNSQMDLYTGALAPTAIAGEVIGYLSAHGLLEPARYQSWLEQSGGYRLVPLPDGSWWVLRWGEVEGCHVHIHPARHSPHSVRVKASALKTGLLVAMWERLHGQPAGLEEVNGLRQAWAGLPPIRSTEEAEGFQRVREWLA